MDECPRDYFNLTKTQLYLLFPNFVANLQAQSSTQCELGRAAVLDHSEGICPTQEIFQSSAKLKEYIDRPLALQAPGPRRRLFLLEDLSRNYIEVLGSRLGVPPSVFAAHWEDPVMPTFNHRNPFVRFSKNRFVIRYPDCHHVAIGIADRDQDTVYALNSNVDRHIYKYSPNGPLIDDPKSYHVLSFWSTGTRDDGPWDGKVPYRFTRERYLLISAIWKLSCLLILR